MRSSDIRRSFLDYFASQQHVVRHSASLVPADDPEALAKAIETLMNDRDLRVRFGKASRKIAVDEYSSTRIGNEITTLYSRLLGCASS